MEKFDDGGSAYPKHTIGGFMAEGKTWLDDAAMRIVAGIASNSVTPPEATYEGLGRYAYTLAQALLAEKRRLENGS